MIDLAEFLFLLACLFAEHTFIVLDKELIEGEFVPGNPHIEGSFLCSAH